MQIPTEIKYGFRTIAIKESNDLAVIRDIGASSHAKTGVIEIQSTLSDSAKRMLVFGALHYFIAQLAIPDYDDGDAERIGKVMYCVLRDNPRLVSLQPVTSVRIMGDDWKIVKEPEHYAYMGLESAATMQLHVNHILVGHAWLQTVFHEIYHVIYERVRLENTPGNEKDVEALSWHLTLLLSQNDFAWLIEG